MKNNINEIPFKKIINHQERKDVESDPVIKELVERIKEIACGENSIGKGATAEVFSSKTNPNVCYKVIHKDGKYEFRHSVYNEGELLAKAKEISRSSDVKVPMPYYSILNENEDGNEFEILVMERLHATSIRDILNSNLDVPNNFDFRAFVSKIENFFSKLHEQRVYHRDAHGGNIMIEDGTGNPCVIDFGSSAHVLLSSEDPYRQINYKGEMIIFTSDEQKLRLALCVNLRRYLFEKYGNIHNL